MSNVFSSSKLDSWACNCIGPQNGEPLCPCQMRHVIIREGRYIQKERDLGPVMSHKLGKQNDTK